MAKRSAKSTKEQITWEIPDVVYDKERNKTYTRGTFLGKGGFGRCYQLTEGTSKKLFAVKIVSKSLLMKQHQREKMAQEISIHRDLQHKYIVGFHSNFEDIHNVYIILELCAQKSLSELLKRRSVVTEPEARYFLKQIMLGVNYLHDKNIIHRDLKLANIFINDQIELKLGDFGLATIIEFNGQRKRTLCGTPNYIAPEILGNKGHSFEVDVWSIGCILYTLLIGKPPFETATLKGVHSKIKRADYRIPTNELTGSVRALIQKMLQVKPALRPNAKQILESDYLTKFYIPTFLPVSCLLTEPQFDNRATSYVPFVQPLVTSHPSSNPNNMRRPPLVERNIDTKTKSQQGSVPPVSHYHHLNNNTNSAQIDTAVHMKNLYVQLKGLLRNPYLLSKGVRNDDDDDAEDPNFAPLVWIVKWIDFEDMYGFGYQLSDDSICISFNDSTTIILLPDGVNMRYTDVNGLEHCYTMNKYPVPELQKKVLILRKYFQQYMSERLEKAGGQRQMPETACMTRLPSMWMWFRTSQSVVMVLTNGTLQINNFREHTKMILCPLMGAITTLELGKPMRTFKLTAIEQYGCTPDLYQKLKYALEKLDGIIRTKCAERESEKP